MQSVSLFSEAHPRARQARANYRHPLRTLSYVTIDAGNGGIIRNLNRAGLAVQAVAPLRERQRIRLRFELFHRLHVDGYGEVTWANPSGQCGIRFLSLPEETARQIDEWIFSDVLEIADRASELTPESPARPEEIALETMNWWSRPVSGRTLAWLVDGLVVTAGLLLYALIFLSIAQELPSWHVTVGAAGLAAIFVVALYWGLFVWFGGASFGVRLARATGGFKGEEKGRVTWSRKLYPALKRWALLVCRCAARWRPHLS